MWFRVDECGVSLIKHIKYNLNLTLNSKDAEANPMKRSQKN